MALIGKIRKNFWFVLLLLGLALAAFILMDMTGSSGPSGPARTTTMGTIDGQKINYQDFSRTEQAYYRNSNSDVFQKRKQIWDFYVEKALINKEAEALGLQVSKDELMDLQFGPNPSPIIQANWRNQTGQLDVASLQNIRTQLEQGTENRDLVYYWAEQEQQIIKEALQTKLNSLINKGVYTPTWMAEESFKMENSKADFNYVKIPFDNIDGSGVELSDSDFADYMAQNKSLYEETEETRVAEFATFNVEASEEDKAAIRENLNVLKAEFLKTDNDSTFAAMNKGSYSYLYATKDQIPESAREGFAELNPGEAYGPFEENGVMLVIKMLDKKVYPDSVAATHVLVMCNRGDKAAEERANAKIDSIQGVYLSGSKSLKQLAIDHSEDGGVATNEGYYEAFPQTQMVKEFTEACFGGEVGGLYKVQTDYGIHLVRVEDQIFNDDENKFKLATISQAIVPSQQTQDAVYDLASEIITTSKSYDALKAAIDADPNVSMTSSPSIKENDSAVGVLGSGQTSRSLVKFLFDPTTEVGDISPEIYRYTDRVNYYDNKYVIATLNSINPKGMKTVASVKDQIETAVMNQKKGEKLASELTVTSLEDIASKYSVEVGNAADVSMLAEFVPGVGNEPKVVGAAFDLAAQTISKPIVGNSGVFVISPLSQQPASAPNNIPFLKNSLATSTKSQIAFKIIDNLKKRADISDNRSTFF